jgi:hypothetical protein
MPLRLAADAAPMPSRVAPRGMHPTPSVRCVDHSATAA